MYSRTLETVIQKRLTKAIILIGPRQVGKTTLIKTMLDGKRYLFLNGDDPDVRTLLSTIHTEGLRDLIGSYKAIFVDEAQRIENIGLTLKIITDIFPEVQLYVSGSSAFELGNATQEPLTGRKWSFELYPISWQEFEDKEGYLKARQQLDLRLRYGFYPDVLNNNGDEVAVLRDLVNSYLYKDILSLSGVRKPDVLQKITQALAYQVCGEVSYNELARLVGVDKNTVSTYIDLLEQAFVIFKLPSFSRNLRTEIRTNVKIYFYDNGVRNAVIGNFEPLELRQDKGALWENFLMSERKKKLEYRKNDRDYAFAKAYFWRTTRKQELDYLEERGQQLYAYEFKYNPKAKLKVFKAFTNTYDAELALIHRENFREFVLE